LSVRIGHVNTERVHALDIPYVSFTKRIVFSGIASFPLELLSINFDFDYFFISINEHDVCPCVKSVENEPCKYNRRNYRPNEFKFVVICKIKCFLSLTPTIFERKVVKECLSYCL